MTVPATDRRAGPFTGTGSQTAFPFTFRVFSATDIQVRLATAGVEAPTTAYTVSINADQDTSPGGTVTMSTAPSTSQTLVIVGATPYNQTLDLPNGGNYSPRALENALDRTVFQIQQLAELQERSLTLPATADGVDVTLPVPSANEIIGWNNDGTALTNIPPASLATVVAFASWRTEVFDGTGSATAFTLAVAPGTASNCDVAISGVTQTAGVDYTVSGTTLTFTSAPPSGTGNIAVRYGQGLPQGTVDAADVDYNPSTVYTTGAGKHLNRTRYLSAYADPSGAVAADAAFTTALAELPRYGELHIDGDFKFAVGGTITNRSNIAIVGKGRLRLVGAASSAMVLQMVGTCDDLLFQGISVVGEANTGYSQTGIGNFSGQILSRIRYINVNASDLNVGLSFLGNGGSNTRWYSSGCVITGIVGTSSGQGYGFHVDNAVGGECVGVHVDGATRHSIYHGRGTNNRFVAPYIVNHRASVANLSFRAAISISRSSGIQIIGGEVLDAYDGQLEIGADSISNAASVSDIVIDGLRLTNRKNSIYGVQIGEQIDPSTYTTGNLVLRLLISDNHVTVGAVPAIIVNNGTNLNFAGTRILRTGINGTTKLLALGNAPYISSDGDCQDTLLQGLEFIAQGSSLTDVRAIDVDADICANTSRHKIGENSFTGVTAPVYFNATLSNPNFWVKQLKGEGAYAGTTLADGVGTSFTVPVTGAQVGDRVTFAYSQPLQGVGWFADISPAGTANVRLQNETGGSVTIAAGTARVYVTRGEGW